MRYFEARDLRDAADTVAVVAVLLGDGIFLADYLPDEHLTPMGIVTSALALLVTSVTLVVRIKENWQMAENESDIDAVGGTD